ncbi:Gfo/Idh/MocA family oxidoreductase [soil metagenome]
MFLSNIFQVPSSHFDKKHLIRIGKKKVKNMSKTYRWGILGPGKIAEKFCEAMKVADDSEVYAIASRDKEKAKLFGEKYNASKYYGSYEEMMKNENVDIIYIATPHSFHYEQAMQCFENNKPVLCEKPMCINYGQSAKLVESAQQKNLFLMEGMWTLCMPFMQKIKQVIDEDKIGKVRCVSAQFGFLSEYNPQNRLWNKKLGGGSLLDVGVYNIFLATVLLGKPENLKCVARISDTGIDEYVNLVMTYSNGATAQLLSSIVFNTNTDAHIFGEKGRIIIKDPWSKATDLNIIIDGEMGEKFSEPHECNGFEYQIREVIECLEKGKIESESVPHKLTLIVSKLMDEILLMAGY